MSSSSGLGWLPQSVGGTALRWAGVPLVSIFLGLTIVGLGSIDARTLAIGLLALLFPIAALIVGDFRRCLLAVIIVDIPLQIDGNLASRLDIGVLHAPFGYNVSLTLLALAGLYVLWLSRFLARDPSRPVPRLRHCWAAIAFVAWMALTTFVARDPEASLVQIWLMLTLLLLYIYVVSTVRTRHDVLLVVGMLMLALLAEGLLMLVERATGLTMSSFLQGATPIYDKTLDGRAGGPTGSPNQAAAYLSLMLPAAAALLVTRASGRYRLLAAPALVLGVLGVVFTFSRGGWIATLIGLSITLALIAGRERRSLGTLALALGVAAPLLIFFGDAIVERIVGDDRGALAGRGPLLQIAERMIRDHPLVGVGANNFPIVMKDYLTPDLWGIWLQTVHNAYLRTWAETGIVGLLLFLWFLFAAIRAGWRCWMAHDDVLSPLGLGIAAGIVGQMTHMMADIFSTRPSVEPLWFMAAFAVALDQVARQPTVEQRPATAYRQALPRAGAGGTGHGTGMRRATLPRARRAVRA